MVGARRRRRGHERVSTRRRPPHGLALQRPLPLQPLNQPLPSTTPLSCLIMAADDSPLSDTPVGVRRWARSDWTRRVFLLSASSGALVFSLGSTSYRWMVDGVDAADLLVLLYWVSVQYRFLFVQWVLTYGNPLAASFLFLRLRQRRCQLLPVLSLIAIPVDWHLPTTLLLLLPSIFRALSPSMARQALVSVLFLIAGSARRAPETRFELSSSIASMTDNDDGLDGRIDEGTEEIRYLEERSGRGNVGGDASSSVFGQLLFWWVSTKTLNCFIPMR